MKKSSLFYAILFLLISPVAIFAAEVNLNESSNGDVRTVAVEIDTKEEVANSLKIAIQVSDNVTVSKIEEGEYACGTFSSTQNGSVIEIACTTQEEAVINTSIAKINFTTTSAEHSFTVLTDQSQIGTLTIDNTRDIGTTKLQESEGTETGNEATEQEQTTTSSEPEVAAQTDTSKKKTITTFLPYILLGVAGILLLSIIILLVTKEKKGKVVTTETTDMPQEKTEPNTEVPSQEGVQEKPSLQEMVNAGINTAMTEQPEPAVGNHESDLEALVMSENPRVDAGQVAPVETTVVEEAPSTDVFTTPVETPVIEEPVVGNTFETPVTTAETPTTDIFTTPVETPVIEQPIVENTFTTDTFATPMETPEKSEVLPNIGFTAPAPTETPVFETTITPQETLTNDTSTTPMDTPIPETTLETPTTTTPTDFYSNLYGTPTEQTPIQGEIEVPQQQEAMDLQALVNSEINNMPAGGEQPLAPTETTPPTEQTGVGI